MVKKISNEKLPDMYSNLVQPLRAFKDFYPLNMQPDFYQGAKIQNIIDKCIESNQISKWVSVKTYWFFFKFVVK